jgi:hypothetical protein
MNDKLAMTECVGGFSIHSYSSLFVVKQRKAKQTLIQSVSPKIVCDSYFLLMILKQHKAWSEEKCLSGLNRREVLDEKKGELTKDFGWVNANVEFRKS